MRADVHPGCEAVILLCRLIRQRQRLIIKTASDKVVQTQLQGLRLAFPLQARIEAASQSARRAYTTLLSAWLNTGKPPQGDAVSAAALAGLLALDAVVQTESGLGCYPFSARETAIRLELDGQWLYAMCAVDALAVAALAQTAVVITSVCSHCAQPLHLRSDADGQIQVLGTVAVRVEYRQLAQHHTQCSADLCPGIVFVCEPCAAQQAESDTLLTLAQASAVARSFFAFQTALLK